jgi:hypothetical protein
MVSRFLAILCVAFWMASPPIHAAIRIFETKPISADTNALTFERKGTPLPLRCSWPPDGAKPVRLDSDTVYKFTVFDGGIYDSHILKVKDGEKTLFDGAHCEVHSTKMELKRVPIIYGLLRPDHFGLGHENFSELQRKQFPNRQEFRGGGCVVSPSDPKHAHVWFCKQCKNAFEEWKAGMTNP